MLPSATAPSAKLQMNRTHDVFHTPLSCARNCTGPDSDESTSRSTAAVDAATFKEEMLKAHGPRQLDQYHDVFDVAHAPALASAPVLAPKRHIPVVSHQPQDDPVTRTAKQSLHDGWAEHTPCWHWADCQIQGVVAGQPDVLHEAGADGPKSEP
jgi:hypothetical protein